MRKKNGLNVIYDALGRRAELKGKLCLKKIPYKGMDCTPRMRQIVKLTKV